MKWLMFFGVLFGSWLLSASALGFEASSVIGEPSSPEEWEQQQSHSTADDNQIYSDVLENLQNKDEYLNIVEQFSFQEIRRTAGLMTAQGLNPAAYWSPQMEQAYLKDPSNNNWDLRLAANEAMLRLIKDVYMGLMNPRSLGEDIKVTQKEMIPAADLRALITSTGRRGDLLVSALMPRNSYFDSLQRAYISVSGQCQRGEWPLLPSMRRELRLGVKDKFVPFLRRRLQQHGYLMTGRDEVYDQQMQAAIVDIQTNLRVKPDGRVTPGARTYRYLNTPCASRVFQIRADMEKIRWLPSQFEDRYIFVNLAFQQFLLRDNRGGRNFNMSFKTINGRAERRTPMMKDRVDYVILNPYWVVPPTIFIEDKVEDIRKLSYWEINWYFQSHNYEVWNRDFTRKYNPASINWWAIDPQTAVDIYIRQRPFLGNALGVLKFMLTNPYSIYLHDTNQRELFAQPNRLLSSGCVRLEKPVDLAEYLLDGTNWNRFAIESTLAKPGQVMDKDTKINLKDKVPVYLVNLTSTLNSDQVLRFAEDTYGQNERIGWYLK